MTKVKEVSEELAERTTAAGKDGGEGEAREGQEGAKPGEGGEGRGGGGEGEGEEAGGAVVEREQYVGEN